ncbi:hypothetical protein [Herbaspirillum sp. NPDC087042]|uniref:hypothetical protein n=1 Tax=Herbaspirillum sp. NPDC087042 TaxID=3364004 RepID=UPI0038045394
MSSLVYRTTTRLSVLALACCLASACSTPDFDLHKAGFGLSGMAQDKAHDRCDGKVGYGDYRDCTRSIDTQYDAWRSQQKAAGEVEWFGKSPGRP